jgi:hypothetical protein
MPAIIESIEEALATKLPVRPPISLRRRTIDVQKLSNRQKRYPAQIREHG